MTDALTLPEGFEVVPSGSISYGGPVNSRLQRVDVGNTPSPTLPEGFEVMDKGQPTWLNAITDIPKEIYRAGAEAVGHIGDLGDRSQQGPIEGLMTTGRAALAVPELLMAPLTGTARSIGGHTLTQLEHLAGQYIAPEIAKKDDLWKMFETSRGDTDLAMSALRPGGAPIKGVVPPSVKPEWMWDRSSVPRPETTGGVDQGVVSASGRLADTTGGPVDVPFSIASDNIAAQRAGQGARNVPFVGDPIVKSQQKLVTQLDTAKQFIADRYGFGTPGNVGQRIGNELTGAASGERAAATEAARRSDEALAAAHNQAVVDANQGIAGHEDAALQRARGAVGDVNPQDMGRDLISRLRTSEAEARANKEALYGRAGESEATVSAEGVGGAHRHVTQILGERNSVIDPIVNGYSGTPAAARMLSEVEAFSRGDVPGRLGGSAAARAPTPSLRPAPSAPQSAAATEVASKAQSLTEFLASKGGLGPDAELGAIGADKHLVDVGGVGKRRLVKQGGSTLDYAREAAEEAGYLSKGSTPNDLLDALDAEMRGNKRYPQGLEGSTTAKEATAAAERARAEQSAFRRGLERDLADAGHGKLGPEVRARTLKIMESERVDADTAVEKAIRQLDHEDARKAPSSDFPGDRAAGDAASRSLNVQEIERARQRLTGMRTGATNDRDRAAATQVMRAFDDWEANAFEKNLMTGTPEALADALKAREANTAWRQRFFNNDNEAGKFITKIVSGEVTPQEVANLIVGSGQVGAKGVASRLLTRLGEATQGDPEAMHAIRGGIWNVLQKTPDKIEAFLSGSGEDVANRLFTAEQRGIMRAYADTVQQGAEARQHVSEVAKTTRPQAMEVGTGPMQDLAETVLGKGGGKQEEAIFRAIDEYAKSGGRGDIQTLARLVKAIPADQKGDLVGAIVRNLGMTKEGFSSDVFATQWKSYTPQAKALLFGNAGPHLKALDDIAAISQQMKEIHRRFGNPSGTAQNRNLFALAAGMWASPIATLSAAVGGAGAAHILAAPATASSAAKWARAYSLVTTGPSVQSIAAYETASRNLANTAQGIGLNINPTSFMRLLQSPSGSRAEDQNQVPRAGSQ